MKKMTLSNKKISIRTRILFSVLMLIVFILLLIIISFNILVSQYIKGNVNEHLYGVKLWAFQNGQFNEKIIYPPVPAPPQDQTETNKNPEMRKIPRGEFGRGEILIVSDAYQMLFPEENRMFIREYDDLLEITNQLKKVQINLNNDAIMRISVTGREYYFVSLKITQASDETQKYLLYCIDMTSISNLAHRINFVLILVLLLALILSIGLAIVLSVVITRPIKELTHFADRIGRSDFQTSKAIYQDLELSTLSDTMNKAAEELDKYNREQKIFFQNVSHELRTPLQSIKSNAEAIQYGVMEHKKASQIIISETNRLSEMVDGLLYFSYLDSKKAQMQLEEFDVREILSNCIERQRAIADNQQVEFDIDFDKKPVILLCDEMRLSRAFSNVLSNAIRYAKHIIKVACHKQENKVKVTILDDGEGISSKELPFIFDRFYKGHRGNHGIGLSIVKTVIDLHHGSIQVQSSSHGTAFVFSFTDDKAR